MKQILAKAAQAAVGPALSSWAIFIRSLSHPMLKAVAVGFACALAMGADALAQTCPAYPYTLTNGSTADASQVMNNFNTIRTCVNGSLAPLASPGFTGRLAVSNGRASPGDGSGLLVQGYQAGVQLMNSTNVQNWYAAINDGAGNEFNIGRGYGPAQGVNIALRINNYDQVGVAGSPPGGWSGNQAFSSVTGGPGWGGSFYNASNGGGAMLARVDNTSAGLIVFYYGSSNWVGSIYTNGTSTSYNTTSDYRLKKDIEPITDGLDRLMRLQPKRYNWKGSPSGPKADGFLAHEVQAVMPTVVMGEKDAVNPDGSVRPQQMDYSKLVPLLVAAVKEQQAEIKALQAAVSKLKPGGGGTTAQSAASPPS